MFILCLMSIATLTAAAETRLLGPPNCAPDTNASAMQEVCERQQAYEAYLATLRKVQNPAAADACSGASAECSYQQAQAQIQVEQQQLAATQACARINDDAGRAACLASASLVNSAMLAEGRAQADATWVAGADVICQQGDPASVGTQEMCDHVSAYRAAQTPTPYAPFCQGLAAPDPRCTGH